MRKIKKTTGKKNRPIEIHRCIVGEMFDVCPFCGEIPNVFQVPENRYGRKNPFGWVVECKNMGCIFQRSSPNQSFKHLSEIWNNRKP